MPDTIEHMTCANTAKLLRTALRRGFPTTKFSVRSHTYSMGASIDVVWTDGPFQRDVQRVCNRYTGASFDSSEDLKEHHDTLLSAPDGTVQVVHFGADFVFAKRELSDTYREQLRQLASDRIGDEITGDGTRYLPTLDLYDNQYIQRLATQVAPDN